MPEPGDIETMLDAAISAHEAHDPDQAQRLCQQLKKQKIATKTTKKNKEKTKE
jgi:hypothetical protein